MTPAPALVLPYLMDAEIALMAAIGAAEGNDPRRAAIAATVHQLQAIIGHPWAAEEGGQP